MFAQRLTTCQCRDFMCSSLMCNRCASMCLQQTMSRHTTSITQQVPFSQQLPSKVQFACGSVSSCPAGTVYMYHVVDMSEPDINLQLEACNHKRIEGLQLATKSCLTIRQRPGMVAVNESVSSLLPQALCLCKLKIGEGFCMLSGFDKLCDENEVGCWLGASLGDVADSEALRFCDAGVLLLDPLRGPADGPSPLQNHSCIS